MVTVSYFLFFFCFYFSFLMLLCFVLLCFGEGGLGGSRVLFLATLVVCMHLDSIHILL